MSCRGDRSADHISGHPSRWCLGLVCQCVLCIGTGTVHERVYLSSVCVLVWDV